MAEEAPETPPEETPPEETPPEETPPEETPPAEEPPAEESTPEATSDDWRTGITDEAARKEAERSQTLNDFAVRMADMRKTISKSIQPLRANAKDEDVAAYRKAIGVPDTPDKYEFKMPEEFPEGLLDDKEVEAKVGEFSKLAHAANIPAAAYGNIMEWYFNEIAAMESAKIKADETFAEETKNVLKDQWGAQYDRELAYSKKGEAFAFGKDLEAFRSLETKDGKFVGDHPVVVAALNKIGRATSEDAPGSFPVDNETALSLRSELNDLTAKQEDHMMKGEHQQAQALDLKIMELSRKISGDDPVTGAGQAA